MKLFHQEQIESSTIISSNWLTWFDLVQAIQSHCKQSRNLCLIFYNIEHWCRAAACEPLAAEYTDVPGHIARYI